MRDQVKKAVNGLAYRLGVNPKVVNAAILKAGHPNRAKASMAQLDQTMVETLARWARDGWLS